MSALAIQSEPTGIGEQTLVPDVAPITMRERLQARMAAPLVPQRPQKPLDSGLFDLAARNQLDLFASLARTNPDPELPPPGG